MVGCSALSAISSLDRPLISGVALSVACATGQLPLGGAGAALRNSVTALGDTVGRSESLRSRDRDLTCRVCNTGNRIETKIRRYRGRDRFLGCTVCPLSECLGIVAD